MLERLEKLFHELKTIHSEFVKSAEKIFLLNVLRPDLLRLSVLTVKQKKKLLREPLDYDQHIAAFDLEKLKP